MIPQSAPNYTIFISKNSDNNHSSSKSTPLSLNIMLLPRSTIAAIQSFLSPPLDRLTAVALHESVDLFLARVALQNKRGNLAREREQEGRQVVMLVEPSLAADDADSLSSGDSISSAGSATAIRNYAASKVWRTATMRPKQQIAVHRILHDEKADGKLLLVDRTGGGKSLTMQMALTMSAGIAIIIVPLLALTADQVEKIKRANQKYGSVEAHHIDDLSTTFIRDILIPR